MSRKELSMWEQAGVLLVLTAVAVGVIVLALFVLFGSDKQREPAQLEPSPYVLEEIPAPVGAGFCEGFITGVAFNNAIQLQDQSPPFFFPTREQFDVDVQECLDAGMPSDPVMPFGETP